MIVIKRSAVTYSLFYCKATQLFQFKFTAFKIEGFKGSNFNTQKVTTVPIRSSTSLYKQLSSSGSASCSPAAGEAGGRGLGGVGGTFP